MSEPSDKNSIAEQLLRQLQQTFVAELPYKLECLEQDVFALKQEAAFQENYENAFRSVHSLKGTAGTHGIYILSTICHQLEDQLKIVDGDIDKMSDTYLNDWLQYVDLMREVTQCLEKGQEGFSSIERKLHVLKKTATSDTMRCLLVSSSKATTQICQVILTDLPVQLSVMANGYEALGRLLQDRFDVLITGRETHGLDGVALIAANKLSKTVNSEIPCILITSKQLPEQRKDIDPDFVLVRDMQLADNLLLTFKKIMDKAA